MHGHVDVADLLLEKGAAINAVPRGFEPTPASRTRQ
jgi:hypothetical protein